MIHSPIKYGFALKHYFLLFLFDDQHYLEADVKEVDVDAVEADVEVVDADVVGSVDVVVSAVDVDAVEVDTVEVVGLQTKKHWFRLSLILDFVIFKANN